MEIVKDNSLTTGPEGCIARRHKGCISRGFVPPTKEEIIAIDELYLETGWGGKNIKKKLGLDLSYQTVSHITHRTSAYKFLPQPLPSDWPEHLIYLITKEGVICQEDLFGCYEDNDY